MNYIDKNFEEKFTTPRNAFIKGKHPDICPDCKEEPIMQDINMPFVDDELWVVQCKCYKPHTKAVTGDSIPEAVSNWDLMIREYKKRSH